ncbi:unnamed protein product, partial [Strongylus vulgaris]
MPSNQNKSFGFLLFFAKHFNLADRCPTWSISAPSDPEELLNGVRDNKSPHTTTIPVVRSPATSSPLANTVPRRSTSRAVQIEKYDSRTITIPPPHQQRRLETRPIDEGEEQPSPSRLWSPIQEEERTRQPSDPGITRWEDIDTENEISIKER